jgi:hypothetical protein
VWIPLELLRAFGFTLDGFTIDTTTATVTCPAGHTVPLSDPSGRHLQRKAVFTDQCTGCLLRERCTTAKTGRILTIRPHHDLQASARRQAATDPLWQADYRRWGPLVERMVAWPVSRGNRRLPHRWLRVWGWSGPSTRSRSQLNPRLGADAQGGLADLGQA